MTSEQVTSFVGKKSVVGRKSVVGKKSVVVEEKESVVDVMTPVVEEMPVIVFWNSDPKLFPVFLF
jgi:carbonic anhydrase/acetyltransferase-like protein (isoleucine patch superfamily)